MRKAKALVILLLCVLLTLLCVGCVDTISVTQYVDAGGSFHRTILVGYDATAPDADELKSEIGKVMDRYIVLHDLEGYAVVTEPKEGEVSLDILFPSLAEYYLWLGQTGREENETEVPVKKGVVDAYDRTIDSYLTESNVEGIRALMDETYRDYPLTAACYYTYGTTNRSTISNGERTEKDGVYYHTWRLDGENQKEMMIRVYGLNVTAIYLIAISVFVLSLAIIFVIIYCKKRKEKIRAAIPHDSPRLSDPLPSFGNANSAGPDESGENEGEPHEALSNENEIDESSISTESASDGIVVTGDADPSSGEDAMTDNGANGSDDKE